MFRTGMRMAVLMVVAVVVTMVCRVFSLVRVVGGGMFVGMGSHGMISEKGRAARLTLE